MNETITPESPFLRSLFKEFFKNSVNYCVLRNYEELPNSLGSSDLDLLVVAEERDSVAELVRKVAERFGGNVIADYATTGRFIKLLGFYDGNWWGCAVDLLAGIDYRGMVYVSSSPMILRAEDYRGIRVASTRDVEVMALLKELVNNGKSRKNYFSEAAKSYQIFGDQSLEILHETFSPELLKRFIAMLEVDNEQVAPIAQMARAMRREIWQKHGTAQVGSLVKNFFCRVNRLWHPPGISLGVTGTDGSGKTTVIKAITPILERAIHTEIYYEHMRPNWMKALGVAAGKRSADSGDTVQDPHAQSPSGIVGSLIRLGYYTTDYLFGYWIKIYPLLFKRVNICLFDRYCYDVILDPRRMRMKLPPWLIRCVFTVVPKPNLVLCLGADPESIYERKPETSLEEVTRQVKGLKRFCSADARARWIDTGCDINDSKNQALFEIMEMMSARYR
ncbi:hypothetical protein HW115_06125 [Verrucomicrobiaceae bacterium N1E253]|uniref:Thymidylate kinase n=1 Tax=Oceaniferula marina TaxID=2748318 RepID=A0A851GDC9_9BACT|nr:hypothetical protein [Oceaniferula marina]NWK55179.1 hypothetical protein [Oceaniferula marina]